MKKIKKTWAILMSVVMILTSLAFSFYSFATTFQNLTLNTLYSAPIRGSEDMIWYTYTPQVSGTYSLVSYTVGKTHAYLYTKTTNPNGSVTYNGLAYAPSKDPNYMDEDVRYFYVEGNDTPYVHTSTAFRLTYHLDAGTKYYFSAGWSTESTESGTINVVLKQDSIDTGEKHITSVTAKGNSSLYRFNDGEWKVDSNGERYYKYNISKVTQNLTITLHYNDGTSTSVTGEDKIDGYDVLYSFNQEENHWYENSNPKYNGNVLTITVSNVSCEYNVPIEVGANYNVQGIVVDYVTGDPVSGATIYWGDMEMATTGSDGTFNINYGYGLYYMTVESEGAFTREIMLNITQSSYVNNHLDEPIPIIVGDYVPDGIINGKDCAYAKRTFTGEKKQKELEKFQKQLCFTPDTYGEFQLGSEVL